MSRTKERLARGGVAVGGWMLIGHAAIAEAMAGEGLDFIGVDLEHTATDMRDLYHIALAAGVSGCDVLARLHAADPTLAKRALDAGAHGIIVPSVNSAAEAAAVVSMAKFPPEGVRGASLCRATDYGRRFSEYFGAHNREVLVVVMLEHIDAVREADAILATPGIDAALIGPYDLSASMGLAGQLDHPDVRAAQQAILEACLRHGVAPGLHVVPIDPGEVRRRIEQGFRFLPCGLDTLFLMEGCRTMLRGARG